MRYIIIIAVAVASLLVGGCRSSRSEAHRLSVHTDSVTAVECTRLMQTAFSAFAVAEADSAVVEVCCPADTVKLKAKIYHPSVRRSLDAVAASVEKETQQVSAESETTLDEEQVSTPVPAQSRARWLLLAVAFAAVVLIAVRFCRKIAH